MTGSFNVRLRTPLGLKNGVIDFSEKDGVLSGSIRTMGNRSYFKSGKMTGNSFEFSGVLYAGLFSFRYTAKGAIDGDTLTATAVTDSGTFQISGARIV